MSDNQNSENSPESSELTRSPKNSFYPSNPTNDELEQKVEELKVAVSKIPALTSYFEQLSSLPWSEYEEILSKDYFKTFSFAKEEIDENGNPIDPKSADKFSIQEPKKILAEAQEKLGAESEAYHVLSIYTMNLITRTMGRAVSIATKKHFNS
ncbi:hypothetical protein EHQ76_18080 [Leptospira barantonii]|uniref:Uncharacterized protein n=1 Tax=Leptospira barantonii TaxID=2023184 RepID=A0A5F2AYF1_9LEPT|nr:hypothetical protein [Leptospira barantonii]TGL93294.1 hypothetical protein EHQ76_18080 [Leptospira barantonii]